VAKEDDIFLTYSFTMDKEFEDDDMWDDINEREGVIPIET